MADTATIDTRESADPAKKPEQKFQPAKFWLGEIEASGKREEHWRKRGNKVISRYRDDRDLDQRSDRRTNILWSNVEILKATLFQGIGNPDVRRRFPKRGKDEKVTRQASLVLERSLTFSGDVFNEHAQVEAAVEDYLLPGRGQCWVVYDADVKEETPETGEDDERSEPAAVDIEEQSVRFEHVYWEDYRTSAGRKEVDVWWKARRHRYNRDELKLYFSEHAERVPLMAESVDAPKTAKNDGDDTFKRAEVWEIWDKTKKQRVYVAEGYEWVLRADDDPYKLRDFFPCPEPIYSVKTTSSLVPIPEYTLYQDQADELDAITTRLYRLVDALRRRGVYDATAEGADNPLSQLAYAGDNEFIPYKGFAALMEKGGLKNVFQSEDLAPIIAVVQGLYQQRALMIQTIYDVTGISDIIRGSSSTKNETATEARIKGQFGSLRIQRRQGQVQRFIRDLYRLKGEIIAEHFTREKLQDITGLDMPLDAEKQNAQMQLAALQQQVQQFQVAQQQAQQTGQPVPPQMQPPQVPQETVAEWQNILKQPSWEEISAILRSDQRRGYKVDIETDSMSAHDEQEEKSARIEFLTAMQGFMERIVPATVQIPESAPLAKELSSFAVRAFKVGRSLEEAFDDFFEKLEKKAEQAMQAPPQQNVDPRIQAEAEHTQAKTEAVKAETQANVQKKQAETQGIQVDNATKAAAARTNAAQGQQDMAHAHDAHIRGRDQEAAQAYTDQVKDALTVEGMALKNALAQKNLMKPDAQPKPGAMQ